MELPCVCFQRFRGNQWLNNYAIFGAMQISDRPAFVKHFPSVPLDDETLRSGTIIRNPLSGLTKKIEGYRREAERKFGTLISLVYFCPLNQRDEHFTLLEINEREKAIRHYDSKADPKVIKGDKTTRISTLVEKEFGRLNFSYSEAVSVRLRRTNLQKPNQHSQLRSRVTVGVVVCESSGIIGGCPTVFQLEHGPQNCVPNA